MKTKLLLISALFFIFMVSCNNELKENVADTNINSKENEKISLSRHELLALYISRKGNLVSSEEVQKKLVKSFNKTLDTKILIDSKNTDVKTLWIKDDRKTASVSDSRKKIDDIPLYIFQDKNENGFILASGDIRLPEVFAYSSQGTFDTNTGTGLDVFCEKLQVFIKDSLERFQANYDSLLVSAYKKQKAIKTELRSEPEDSEPEDCNEVAYEDSAISDEEYGPFVQVEWGQGYPHNTECPVVTCEGTKKNAMVGCMAVACAQIMSYHKFPPSLDGNSFDWDNMTAMPLCENISPIYQTQVAKLMHLIGVGINTNYNYNCSSAAYFFTIRPYFISLGYTSDYVCNYNLNTIKSSLINNCPVFISGDATTANVGHGWVLDGYKKIKTVVTYSVSNSDETINVFSSEIFSEYVHLNWGWWGTHDGHNGFYLSSVMSYTPQNEDYHFTRELEILPNIRPD
jgi:hypothetical protein